LLEKNDEQIAASNDEEIEEGQVTGRGKEAEGGGKGRKKGKGK